MFAEAAQGVELMWDNKLIEAEAIFSKYKDTNPRHALLYAEVCYIINIPHIVTV